MALTLLEAAKLNSGDVLRSTIVEIFAASDDLLSVMPFRSIDGGAYKYTREGALGGIAFRGLNEGYTESAGSTDPLVEQLMIAGGDLDVDKAIVDFNGPETRAAHEAMKAKKLAHTVGNKMVKGDSSTTPKEFDGLQVRLVGDQRVDAGSTSGGDPLSLAKMDELIDAVDDPNSLLMSKAMRRRFTAASRTSGATTPVAGHINFEQDQFGRTQTVYNGLPILIADRNDAVFATLAFDESSPGGGSTGTSIYCMNMGENMLMGLQNGIPDVRDLGEIDTQPVFRTRVEWYVSLLMEHPRAAARLWGISDDPIVA